MLQPTRKEKIVIACRKAWENAGRGKMLLGVSGGADSTALVVAFSKAKIPFEVVHCNFNLRGSESIRDREFVRVLCKHFDAKLQLAEFDVAAEALREESTEMTCRRLRYDFFRKLKESEGFGRIVIAHNEDDNIETFFLHALRGSGSRGLKGMEEDTGEILRPLLHYRRREILEFLKQNSQTFVTDSTNFHSDDYRRNFLRNEVFPLLESKWEGFTRAIATTIELQKHDNRIVEHFTSKALEGVGNVLPWHVLYNFPDKETLIFRFVSTFGGTPTIAREMAASADKMTPGKEWRIAEGTTARFTRKGIAIFKEEADTSALPDYNWKKIEGDHLRTADVHTSPLSVAYLDEGPDAFEWQPATIKMKIKSLGMQGTQPVWKVLKDAGLSPAERKNFMVLVDKGSGEPIWLPGIKRSRLHLVAPDAHYAYMILHN